MTHAERLIVSAYTGYLMVPFQDLHEYTELVLDRPVYTHEFADGVFDELQEHLRPAFLALCER